MEEEGVADGPVEDAVENMGEGFALVREGKLGKGLGRREGDVGGLGGSCGRGGKREGAEVVVERGEEGGKGGKM